ncbi:hypothetical protein ACHAW5_001492 [Stephanodiscus triporus]|uniref:Mannosyltransferase n=1 Tax=Stephanodiscus triporus TaxID=2934178 RepID=A0ABD3N2W3_9STRA
MPARPPPPSPYRIGSAFSVMYIALRLGTSNINPISDCDEVYNYWEPLHFVLYGTGMQTWEYSPLYALRTYAYLLPMAAVATVLRRLLDVLPPSLIRMLSSSLTWTSTSGAIAGMTTTTASSSSLGGDDKPLLFALLRSTISLLSCVSELSFLDAIHDVWCGDDTRLSHWTAFVSLTSTGSHVSGPAFLPSSSVATLWRWSASCGMRGRHGLAILCGLLSTIAVGWPFCAAIFAPTGIVALYDAAFGGEGEEKTNDGGGRRRRWGKKAPRVGPALTVLLRTSVHAVAIQVVVSIVDRVYYGRFVCPNWNIFVYNARSGGDELYGTEPISYYVRNLLLNFNYVALLGVASVPIASLSWTIGSRPPARVGVAALLLSVLSPMYVWMAAIFPRPHKEERFLFPIYPMICLGAATTVGEVLRLTTDAMFPRTRNARRDGVVVVGCGGGEGRGGGENDRRGSLLLGLALLAPSAMISVSRSAALRRNYSAPLAIYRDLFYHASTSAAAAAAAVSDDPVRAATYVCTAGEWHRFPSSFFLPPNHRLGFLRSSFDGQLPQPFTEYGSRMESLGVQAGKFNDVNREETDRYVDIGMCSYVVELVPPLDSDDDDRRRDVPECLRYMESDPSAGSWKLLASREYLDAESTSPIHRILYIPFVGGDRIAFGGYNLYVKDV